MAAARPRPQAAAADLSVIDAGALLPLIAIACRYLVHACDSMHQ